MRKKLKRKVDSDQKDKGKKGTGKKAAVRKRTRKVAKNIEAKIVRL